MSPEHSEEFLNQELNRSARKVVIEVLLVQPGEDVVITADNDSDNRVIEATSLAVSVDSSHKCNFEGWIV